eukprot:3060698-Pleurochrysis_carterae.AAC.1
MIPTLRSQLSSTTRRHALRAFLVRLVVDFFCDFRSEEDAALLDPELERWNAQYKLFLGVSRAKAEECARGLVWAHGLSDAGGHAASILKDKPLFISEHNWTPRQGTRTKDRHWFAGEEAHGYSNEGLKGAAGKSSAWEKEREREGESEREL